MGAGRKVKWEVRSERQGLTQAARGEGRSEPEAALQGLRVLAPQRGWPEARSRASLGRPAEPAGFGTNLVEPRLPEDLSRLDPCSDGVPTEKRLLPI